MSTDVVKPLSEKELNRDYQPVRFLGLESYGLDRILQVIAKLSFAGLIVTSPFRYRIILLERIFPQIYREYTDILLYASDVCLILVITAWLGSVLVKRKIINFGPMFITLPLIGLLICGLISIFFSIDPVLSSYNLLRLILLTILYFYIVNETRSLSEFVFPVGLMVFIQSSIGIAQALEQSSVGFGFLGELELNPEWRGISIVATEGYRSLRAYGLTDHPNILGGCLAFGMAILLTGASITERKWLLIISGLFSLGVISLLFTYSRSAWVAGSIGTMIFLVLLLKLNLKEPLYISINLLIASVIMLIPFVWTNLDLLGIRINIGNSFTQIPQETQSIGERILLNQAANEIFSTNPITGIGLSAFPKALASTNPEFPVDYQPAHFVLLDVAAETGIFGGFFFAILLISPWIVLWINRRRINFTPSLIGVTCLLLVMTIIGFFDYYPWLLAPGRIWQWLTWGLWGAVYQASKK